MGIELSASAADAYEGPRQLLIDGERRDALCGGRFDVFNPAAGRVRATVAEGAAADVDLAVKVARRTFEAGVWRNQPASARAKVLWRMAELIDQRVDALSRLEVLDNGTPISIARYGVIPGAQSGWGRENGEEGLSAFLETKSIYAML